MQHHTNATQTSSKKERLIKHLLFPLLILLSVLILYFLNYKEGTWLMGWDNLMSEFNFDINWERHITSAWQEYQGVGLEGGISWGADLPRVITTWVFSWFMPANMIRYSYIFYCLFVGSLGIYYFVYWLLQLIQKKQEHEPLTQNLLNESKIAILAFVTSMFYIFNHGTLETFYAPIETFPTQWAFTPWLVYLFLKIIREGKRKDYIKYLFLSLLATPMAQVPTTYIMFGLFLAVSSLLILIHSLILKNSKETSQRIIILAILTFCINAFWILPFVSFYASGGPENVQNASINQVFSEDIYYRNAARGQIKDTALLRGYLYDTYDTNPEMTKFVPMMTKWIEHYEQPLVSIVGYIYFIIIILGVFYSIYKKLPYWYIFTTMFVVSLFFLGASNPPFGFAFDWLRENSSLFREAMRFPYTKTAQIATFVYSINFLFGLLAIRSIIRRMFSFEAIPLIAFATIYSLMMYMLPALQGNFLHDGVRVQIPNEYFQMFEWFEDQPSEARIANLPQSEHINWYYYEWGYRGSGFLWYGLKQPVLDRSFDSWSPYNEQYFLEMRDGIYKSDPDQVAAVMKKYNVGWILFDKSFQTTDENELFYEEFIPILIEHPDFEVEKEFGESIVVISYKGTLDNPLSIKLLTEINREVAITGKQFNDPAIKQGNYVQDREAHQSSYLLRDLDLFEKNVTRDFNSSLYTFTYSQPLDGEYKLVLPDYWDYENYIPFSVKNYKITPILPTISINDKKVTNENRVYQLSSEASILVSGIDVLDLTLSVEQNIFAKKGDPIVEYSHTPTEDIIVNPNTLEFMNCRDEEDNESSDTQVIRDIIVLNTNDNEIPCVEYEFVTSTSTGVTEVQFEYRSDNKHLPSVCLIDSLTDKCVPEVKLTSLTSTQAQYETYQNYFFTQGSRKYTLRISLYGNEGGDMSSANLNVKDINIKQYDNPRTILSTEQLATTFRQELHLYGDEGETEINITYPLLNNSSLSQRIELESIEISSPNNCFGESIFKPSPDYNLSYTPGLDILTLDAVNADNCVYIWNRDRLPLDANYLFTISHENLKNYPIEVRLQNKEHQFYPDSYLLDGKSETSALSMRSGENEKGLSIELHNLSRGHLQSINTISKPSVQYYPLQYISNVHLKLTEESNSNILISDYEAKRVAPFLYQVDPGPKSVGIMLEQGYSKGWKAFSSGQTLDHYIGNSWNNTWLYDTPPDDKITIVFMPQMMQFIGYFLIIPALILVTSEKSYSIEK